MVISGICTNERSIYALSSHLPGEYRRKIKQLPEISEGFKSDHLDILFRTMQYFKFLMLAKNVKP